MSHSQRKRGGLDPRPMTMKADFTRPCPDCAAQILIGDSIIRRDIGWTHLDCRGRIEHELGMNPEAYKPAPKDWESRPRCPECSAFMTKTDGGFLCTLSERHPSGGVVVSPS